jgi:sortase A
MKPDTTQPTHHASHTRDDLSVPSRESAVNLIRGQLEALYSAQAQQTTTLEATPAQQAATNTTQATPSITAEDWKKYHSAWQEYYQKYYQHYYTTYAHRVIQQHSAETAKKHLSATATKHHALSSEEKEEKIIRQKELAGLRQKLLDQIRESAKKVRGSRHFIPTAAAICVVLIFSFLQYNSILMANVQAYISPGAINPQNIIVDPTTDVAVGPEPKLIIPKLNIDVPVVYGIGADDKSQMDAMQHGVAHWPGSDFAKSVPGQAGNTVIAGHSSNDLFEAGDYKFVFSQLDRLEKGDTIYANYEGKRYTYTVTDKNIVQPKGQWQDVIKPTDKPMLELVTCWPLGTAQKRMIITAEQVAPNPTAVAAAPPQSDTVATTESMTGNSPTLLESFFNLFR